MSELTTEDKIIADLKGTDLTYEEIARKYGYSYSGIAGICRRRGINRPHEQRRKRGPKPHSSVPYSGLHKKVGNALYLRRCELGIGVEEYGRRHGRTKFRVRAMELGIHDFTLTELQSIAEELSIPFEELLGTK